MKKRHFAGLPALLHAAGAALTMTVYALPAWFGHMRYTGRLVHPDDHRSLARQAMDHLLKEEVVAGDSDMAENRETLETACGMLDIVETESGRVPGRFEWDYSHFYDPLADHGLDDRRFVNALDEFRDFWERSRVHLRIGSTEKAYRFLGYCCHLLQDMAVPAHTYCVVHGFRSRTADNLELVSRSKRFYLRAPPGPPYPGDDGAHVEMFISTALESRGREPFDRDARNEISDVLDLYYVEPHLERGAWIGAYVGEPYYPRHRWFPSSPRIRLDDMVELRNYLMRVAAERTAQLLEHYTALMQKGA